MANQRLYLLFVLLFAALTTGCASSGAFNTATVTNVELSEPNYEIVATNVAGRASAAYLLGLSGSYWRQLQTVALVRVKGTGMLYSEAVDNLWNNFQEKHGRVEGRDLALINVRYDTEALNLLVYTRPTVVVRADVVEFIQE